MYDIKYSALLNHTSSAIISGWKEMKIQDTPGPQSYNTTIIIEQEWKK